MPGFGYGEGQGGIARRMRRAIAVGGTSPTRYSFAATRFRWPVTARAISGSNTCLIQQFVFASPDYPVSNPRFFMAAFYNLTGGQAQSEVANPNIITVEGLSISLDGGSTWSTVPGANLPATIDPATMPGMLLDAIGVTIPASTTVIGRVAYNVPSGGSLPCTPRATTFGGSGLVEASEGSTASRAAKLTGGTLTNANSHADSYQPAFMVAQGGDGRPTLIVVGDSIGYGANDHAAPALWSNRGAFGYIQRGLDDNSASKRIASANFCVQGSKPLDWQARSNWSKKLDSLQLVKTATGDWPFDEVLSQHGTNSIAGAISYATLLAGMETYYTLMETEWGKPITQIELLAKATSSDGYTTLANEVTQTQDSYSTGQRWQLNAAIGTNGAPDPTTTLRTGGYIQDSFAAWPYGSYDTGANRGKLRLRAFATTLAAAAAQNATSFSMTAPPTVGEYLNIVCAGGFADGIVTAVSGSGPYTVAMVMTAQVGAGGAALGAAVHAQEHAQDGTHPGPFGHRDDYTQAVVAWKQRRGWA